MQLEEPSERVIPSREWQHTFPQWVSYLLKSFLLTVLKVSYVEIVFRMLKDYHVIAKSKHAVSASKQMQ